MKDLEQVVSEYLDERQQLVSAATFQSNQYYCRQLLRFATRHSIRYPCEHLYTAFMQDDHNSKERRKQHFRLIRAIDRISRTHGRDLDGQLLNLDPLPIDALVDEYFEQMFVPDTSTPPINYVVIRALQLLKRLQLTTSTIGQYANIFNEIRGQYGGSEEALFSKEDIKSFLAQNDSMHEQGKQKEWKWKIRRKAALVLLEVASTGTYEWRFIAQNHSLPLAISEARSQYLMSQKTRNLSPDTLNLYDYVFRHMMLFAKITTAEELSQLQARQVQYMVEGFSGVCQVRSLRTIMPICRQILRYLYVEGHVEKQLAGLVLNVAQHRSHVADYLEPDEELQIRKGLQHSDLRSVAMILLALRLGLRDSDICRLKFSQIDWQKDTITVQQKKTNVPLVLPLIPEVGNALMDYILHERPSIANDTHVFLRKQAPHRPLESCYAICANLLEKSGINTRHGIGMHLLRRTFTHRLLAAKIPHSVITNALGHRHKESDKPYISMEPEMLRKCALNLSLIGVPKWGVVSC